MRGWERGEGANWSQDPGEERPSSMPTSPDCQFVPVYRHQTPIRAMHGHTMIWGVLTSKKQPYTSTHRHVGTHADNPPTPADWTHLAT